MIAPEDASDVAALLHACALDGAAVVARGGATLQSIGNAPLRCDVALSTTNLRGVVAYDPRDMTVGIAAGTTLTEVARILGEAGQHVPFDAPFPDRATIGGTIAAGWAGPRRATYGAPRDLMIGSVAALVDGSLAHAGGMVVKNVTGYDMSKVYAGSLGTLGILVRANFKALPRAPFRRLAMAPLPPDAGEHIAAALAALDIEPVAALAIDGFPDAAAATDARRRLAVLYEGSERVVERATRELQALLGAAGSGATQLSDGAEAERIFAGIIDAYVGTSDASLTFKSTGLPSTAWSRASAAIARAAACGLTGETIADIRTGDVILRASASTPAAFAAVVAAYATAVRSALRAATILAGTPALRATIDAWGAVPATIATMRDLKARFDPTNILAPGRYVGGI